MGELGEVQMEYTTDVYGTGKLFTAFVSLLFFPYVLVHERL